MGIPISKITAAAYRKRFVPSRRAAACASVAVAAFAGPASVVATAHAAAPAVPAAIRAVNAPVGGTAAKAPVKGAASTAGTGGVAKPAAAAPKPAAPAPPAVAPKPAAPAAPAPAAPAAPAAAPVSAPVAPKPVDPYVAATNAQLEPTGLYGAQEYFTATSDEWANAKVIVQVAKDRGMSPYAAVIAVATAMQESSLHNITAAVNADSLGLFQQRPSMGWGSAAQLTDPSYAAGAFLKALTQYAPDYNRLSLWQAAQATQRSGYPTQYARWEDQAARMVHQIASGL